MSKNRKKENRKEGSKKDKEKEDYKVNMLEKKLYRRNDKLIIFYKQ